ncbi:single-stranded-DNA-specific exonuclease RecJ [Heyndrickxia ginsengihumi]|uniref:Single-stranded-DNA-specific exonuclease RecJ n=1 Tax=Heyndrickxia ginsengihumi TaxID=363870 RepID=A0A0A6VJS6_9BACI|nr:single-stranded-DNA-specific exonuclease RecJ [Heyndrickxia ginsengihumi]KHD86854.1 recombinase RecJ [Heyndrickxia ginsengihumi]MBE6184813.1 single-stranded-DNA-specific exonuclease RecJ [Bacillus sp. (in: firmicutes)]NEY20459.1 single-stranded-DNA-specific exonuclease RecJ [Heyndrickxia ginsengihumi]
MLDSKTRWRVSNSNDVVVESMTKQLNIAPLVAKLLVNRGIENIDEARSFLFQEEGHYFDPFLLHDMEKSINRIKIAIENEEPILVFGDYDADGVSSTAVMMSALNEMGANAQFYIPNRFTEGYGPNEAAFKWAAAQGFQLIITVDTGIAAVHEASVAKELGLTLIITDHHEPGPVLPDAFAIVHPKHPDSIYPFKELAGVGVAFKVAHALLNKVPEHLEDLAAIGTVADLVPLLGENRLIAKNGISRLRTSKREGIQALCKVSEIEQSEINEETIGFVIAPRLNAAGRLGQADPAAELLLSDHEEEAFDLATEINELNQERQKIVNEMTKEAIQMVEESFQPDDTKVIVVGKEGWNAGVIGIVASRLVERFYRPTIVLSYDQEKGLAKGSARSIEGFHLFNQLSECRDILPHFGGHPMAAGMTLSIEHVDELRERLNRQAAQILSKEDFIPITTVNIKIGLEDVDLDAIRQLDLLAPFGTGNPKPKVLIEQVEVQQLRQIGADQQHLKLLLTSGDYTLDGIGFGLGDCANHISPDSKLSLVGELSINEWNNIRKPQMIVRDLCVDHWQLFDFRGHKPLDQWVLQVPKQDQAFIVFQEETIERLQLSKYPIHVEHIQTETDAIEFNTYNKNIVLLDLPTDADLITKLIRGQAPSRIYAYFFHQQDHFFSTFPTREHFKWFYAFLAKRKTFDLQKHGDDLAAYRGWSRNTVDFISQVFFDLEFVTIKDGLISLNSVKHKRDLQESLTYQRKQAQYKMEKDLLYSSFHELRVWFDQLMKPSAQYEEEAIKWI